MNLKHWRTTILGVLSGIAIISSAITSNLDDNPDNDQNINDAAQEAASTQGSTAASRVMLGLGGLGVLVAFVLSSDSKDTETKR